jgi:diadenosine tetraphosphate (Ap4A) HIT family hydrolase
MTQHDCKYCRADEKELSPLMTHVTDLPASKVYLWNDQTYYGRCVVAFNGHKTELFALTPDELEQYMRDVALVAKVVAKASHCQKVNYAIFGDTVPHLHLHVVPKAPDKPNWGEAFVLMPSVTSAPDSAKAAQMLELLRTELVA